MSTQFKMTSEVRKLLDGIERVMMTGKKTVHVGKESYQALLNAIPEKERHRYTKEIPYLSGIIKSI